MIEKTVARSNMEKIIDEGLSTGGFWDIAMLYVMIRHATCRHINHTGPLGRIPSKKDRCAVKTAKVDKNATEAKLQAWEKGEEKEQSRSRSREKFGPANVECPNLPQMFR